MKRVGYLIYEKDGQLDTSDPFSQHCLMPGDFEAGFTERAVVFEDDAVAAIEEERIVAAAHLINGITYSMPKPARHHTILHALDRHQQDLAIEAGPDSQGFLTNTGRFVSREEGAQIAVAAGQIDKPKYGATTLYSEDLW